MVIVYEHERSRARVNRSATLKDAGYLQKIRADDDPAREILTRSIDLHLLGNRRIIRRNEVREHQHLHTCPAGTWAASAAMV